jgi:hypothetical protein
MILHGILRPGMRTYFIPLTAGVALSGSAFLPWVVVGGMPMPGMPDAAALWVLGLGVAATLLAILSLVTRRNSRHPLLLVGLIALAITFLSFRILPESARDRALTVSQAFAIVENTPTAAAPASVVGAGLYLGLVASAVLVAFGLTIVIKRVSQPYIVAPLDDDV